MAFRLPSKAFRRKQPSLKQLRRDVERREAERTENLKLFNTVFVHVEAEDFPSFVALRTLALRMVESEDPLVFMRDLQQLQQKWGVFETRFGALRRTDSNRFNTLRTKFFSRALRMDLRTAKKWAGKLFEGRV